METNKTSQIEITEFLILRDSLQNLQIMIEDLLKNKNPEKEKLQSDHIHELAAALSKAQGMFKEAHAISINPHYKSKYAKMDSLVRATQDALEANGLCVVQDIVNINGSDYFYSKLMHASGQFTITRMRILPDKSDIQSYGKYLTYLSRYAYKLQLRIAITDDPEDDDGEELVQQSRREEIEGTTKEQQAFPKQDVKRFDVITKEQYEELVITLQGWPEIEEKVKRTYNLRSLADFPKAKWSEDMAKIRNLIRTRSEGK